jgi:hypothetical protein
MVDINELIPKASSYNNAKALVAETEWLARIIETRVKLYLGEACEYNDITTVAPPDLSGDASVYAEFVNFYQLNTRERITLMMALLPQISPQLLGNTFRTAAKDANLNAELCAVKSNGFSGLLPSGETVLFVLAGTDLALRFSCQQLFDADHVFRHHHILSLSPVSGNDPYLSGQLTLNEEYIDFFTIGKVRKPAFSTDFPAKRVSTEMEWNDLVLDSYTFEQLKDIRIWLEHGHHLLNGWGMAKRLKPGYKALFYGPPGTGKTLAAGLLGKQAGIEVYRVDLSMVVSKYIGETEKNLEKVFRKAEHKNWILFFDEADALFGKRTSISDAHDKYANQEIAYLLQRLEDYNGLVILSSNMRNNVDEAFGRRLQSIIHFPMPRSSERLRLWKNSFSTQTGFDNDVNLEWLAEKFELAGGSIINVVQYASLMALDRGDTIIRKADLWEGVRKEYIKEGRSI